MGARNWEAEKREGEQAIVEAKRAFSIFMESPAGRQITAAEKAFEEADAEWDRTRDALRSEERDAEIRLRIKREVKTGKMIEDPDDDREIPRSIPETERHYTPEFLAAASLQIGLPLSEADAIPGENSYHGSRVTGRQLYVKILGVLKDRIIADDPRVRETAGISNRAWKARKKAEESRDKLQREHADALRGPARAESALRRLRDEETIAKQKAEAAVARLAAKPPKDPEVSARMKAVKDRLLALDTKHTDKRDPYGDREIKRGAPVEWWKG